MFAVLHHHACDDYYYDESLCSIHPTWEQAKDSVDSFLVQNEKEQEPYDGVDGEPFITIVQMKWGDTERKVLYNTTDHQRKEQRKKEKAEERKKKREEKKGYFI